MHTLPVCMIKVLGPGESMALQSKKCLSSDKDSINKPDCTIQRIMNNILKLLDIYSVYQRITWICACGLACNGPVNLDKVCLCCYGRSGTVKTMGGMSRIMHKH